MNRPLIVSILLITAMAASFLLPKPNYTSLNILDELKIPAQFAGWKSQDVSEKINLGEDGKKFISNLFARLYQNKQGQQVMFLVLDAGNFHNPKVCYGSSGFSIKELETVSFTTGNTTFKANVLNMERQKNSLIMFYWLCIDKKMVDWTGQKMMELWSSLSDKKKAGLMVRLDIHSTGRTQKECIALARDFIRDLNESLSPDHREYLFGQ